MPFGFGGDGAYAASARLRRRDRITNTRHCTCSQGPRLMTPADILGPSGIIGQKLPNYESRPQQLEMAEAVADAIAGRHHLMVEAGTGVGKSFAYLVPAIQAAGKDCRVVVSTHTISLQEQLVRKDIPFLQNVLPQPFTATLV